MLKEPRRGSRETRFSMRAYIYILHTHYEEEEEARISIYIVVITGREEAKGL